MTSTATAPDAFTLGTMDAEELCQAVAVWSHDDDALAAILGELDRRESTEAAVGDRLADAEADQELRRAQVAAERRRLSSGRLEPIEQTIDRMFDAMTAIRYAAAEEFTNGHMLNRAGRERGIDPWRLMSGDAAVTARYASEELVAYFHAHGRVTWIEFKAHMLGRPSDVARAAEIARRAADFGLTA